MKTIILSNIHGYYDEMHELLTKCGFNPDKDILIINGDLLDHGPCCFECLEYAKNLYALMGDRFVYIRGDHEDMLIDANELGVNGTMGKRMRWEREGGCATRDSLINHGCQMYDEAKWIREHTVFCYETDQFICVHGDISKQGIAETCPHIMMWGTFATDFNFYSGKLCIAGQSHVFWPEYLNGSENRDDKVKIDYNLELPLPKTGLININTGGTTGGRFTAMVIDEKNKKMLLCSV